MTGSNEKLVESSDVVTALQLLTRLPLPATDAPKRSAQAVWAYPVAGVVVGALAALVGTIGLWLGLNTAIVAALTLLTFTVTTGAMHEDGLADSADGLWGDWDRARRLEIMRDSRIGTYGVIALVMSFIVRWAALTAIVSWEIGLFAPLIAVGAVSRVPMAVLLAWLPAARSDGLGATVARPEARAVALTIAIGVIASLLFVGWAIVWIAFWIALTTLAVGRIARSKIGGQTGDILGASQQVAEITALCVLSATFA
ncbi:adenosylcobinamide-GDP ribazoletransferase [Aliiroseovarius sp. YM-037]|uniref:adenosylcobinamide-GDP ribazoletransferase n=1 Tax=Aliiroseovarius sp. YM-037 TaxID=3341728 RepID=UPI003A7F9837